MSATFVKPRSVYDPIETGAHAVRWAEEGDYSGVILVVVTRELNGEWRLTSWEYGWIQTAICKGTTFADLLRVLLDDECPDGPASCRDPGCRWQGVTKYSWYAVSEGDG